MLELEAEGAVQNAEGETLRDFVPRIYLQATKSHLSYRTDRCVGGSQLFLVAILRHSVTLTLQATHEKTLEHVPLETLMRYAIDADEAQAEVTRIDGLRAQLAKGVSFEAE